MKEEVPIGNIGKSTFTAVDKSTDTSMKKGLKEKFSLTLLGQQIQHIREYFVVDASDKVAFLINQAAVEDLSMVEPGFDLILSSFTVE